MLINKLLKKCMLRPWTIILGRHSLVLEAEVIREYAHESK